MHDRVCEPPSLRQHMIRVEPRRANFRLVKAGFVIVTSRQMFDSSQGGAGRLPTAGDKTEQIHERYGPG